MLELFNEPIAVMQPGKSQPRRFSTLPSASAPSLPTASSLLQQEQQLEQQQQQKQQRPAQHQQLHHQEQIQRQQQSQQHYQDKPLPVPRPPPPRRVDSSGSEDNGLPIAIAKSRQQQVASSSSPSFVAPQTPIYAQFVTSHGNSSSASLAQNSSRSGLHTGRPATHSSPLLKGHSRKHSATPGLFEPTLPSTSTSNLSQIGMSGHGGGHVGGRGGHNGGPSSSTTTLSASQIAAQAAVMSHQQSREHLGNVANHTRQRSQTVPFPGESNEGPRRGSGSKGLASPPMLSLTEASAPRDNGFSGHGQVGVHSSAATAAANVVFPRSGHNSPRQQSISPQPSMPPPPAPPAPALPEKPLKSEKSKVKLFSRPVKIGTKGETKEKPLPSPGKIGSALSALQRANFSTTSLIDSGSQSMYNLNNSSSATIRPIDTSEDKGKEKEKEKRHHFLSRQKQKLKDEYHLPLSSAASNSRPTDPSAPNPLYNFNIPPSPGPNSTGFSKAKKDKKNQERSDSRLESEASFTMQNEWPGPSSLTSLSQSVMYDPIDPGKLGLHNHLSLDDAWPYLKAKLLVIFEGEDLRLPVEDFNRVVQMHIQWCIHKRQPNTMLEDLRELLATGFASLDRTLRDTPEDRFIPSLVELWLFTFTSILPYIQAVFLPLDLEISGHGSLMTAEQSREFWGGVLAAPAASDKSGPRVTPAAPLLDVRRLVLIAYRDIVILPRYDTMKNIFSRLSLEFLPSSLSSIALSSPTPEAAILSTSPSESFSSVRPGTAMSLDPSVASYNSTSTTLLGDGSAGTRSRAISNVSFGSDSAIPMGASAANIAGGSGTPMTTASRPAREQNVEDSKQVTDMVGRMLQCMSVLSSLGGDVQDEGNAKMVELCKMLKLNWLGRGRTGRNRRGMVGGRVRREEMREEVSVI